MTREPLNVLFLCTGNSARSIIGEAIINRVGAGKFKGFSAGSMPKGEVHPLTLKLLRRLNYDTAALRSKAWDEFSAPGAPRLATSRSTPPSPSGRGVAASAISMRASGALRSWAAA